jgi:hypothetical protein
MPVSSNICLLSRTVTLSMPTCPIYSEYRSFGTDDHFLRKITGVIFMEISPYFEAENYPFFVPPRDLSVGVGGGRGAGLS